MSSFMMTGNLSNISSIVSSSLISKVSNFLTPMSIISSLTWLVPSWCILRESHISFTVVHSSILSYSSLLRAHDKINWAFKFRSTFSFSSLDHSAWGFEIYVVVSFWVVIYMKLPFSTTGHMLLSWESRNNLIFTFQW